MTFLIGTPHSRNAGYFINNQNCSARGGRQEADVQTCAHCECIMFMHKWKEQGAFCRCCMKPICYLCGGRLATYGCENALRRIERYADAVVKYGQYLKMAGLEPVAPTPSLIVTG